MVGAQKWIATKTGIPVLSDFNFTNGQGTPIVIDLATNLAYYINTNVVTAISASASVPDPIVPADGTQNITGNLAASGTVTGSNLSGTNTGDQTSIVGITGTKAQFNTACTDGDFLYVGDVTQYTDEMAQDAVGAMVDASLTYVDATPLLQRAALTGHITAAAGSNATLLGSFTLAQLNTALSDANIVPEAGGTFTGDIIVPAEVYGVGWNGSNEAPTKNDLYDKIETLGGGITGVHVGL